MYGSVRLLLESDAPHRLRHWLLDVVLPVDLESVAGAYDHDAGACYAYPEAAGYALTWLASLSKQQSTSQSSLALRAIAIRRWLTRLADAGMPTRIARSAQAPDWRDQAHFCFDLAMVLRGLVLAHNESLLDQKGQALVEELIVAMSDFVAADRSLHAILPRTPDSALPDRWSTRAGAFLAKPAAAILQASTYRVVPETLRAAAIEVLNSACRVRADCIHAENRHAALYAAEGLLLAGSISSQPQWLAQASAIVDHQTAVLKRDGRLTESGMGIGPERVDVLAQWLRLACCLGIEPALRSIAARRLAAVIRPDGSVPFAFGHARSLCTTWGALFVEQALSLHAAAETDARSIACLS